MNQISGTRNRTPVDTEKMNDIICKLRNEMRLRCVDERDYSILERTSRLLEKYSDEEKLIYDIEQPISCKKNPEKLSLRYDLTTQFGMYAELGKIRTFQVGKVFRREKSSKENERLREFYQFDYDIKGFPSEFMLADCFDTLIDCLNCLGLEGRYTIKINDRDIVNSILTKLNIPPDKFNTVCSSLDKLDKTSWGYVLSELKEKEICTEGFREAFESILPDNNLDFIRSRADCEWVSTLVRGFAYYTGIIFEVVESGSTIVGGGTYAIKTETCIGFSIGLDRVIDRIPYTNKKEITYIITDLGNTFEAFTQAKKLRKENKNAVIYPTSKSQIGNTILKIKNKNKDNIVKFQVISD